MRTTSDWLQIGLWLKKTHSRVERLTNANTKIHKCAENNSQIHSIYKCTQKDLQINYTYKCTQNDSQIHSNAHVNKLQFVYLWIALHLFSGFWDSTDVAICSQSDVAFIFNQSHERHTLHSWLRGAWLIPGNSYLVNRIYLRHVVIVSHWNSAFNGFWAHLWIFVFAFAIIKTALTPHHCVIVSCCVHMFHGAPLNHQTEASTSTESRGMTRSVKETSGAMSYGR